jgi:hypothetical protein
VTQLFGFAQFDIPGTLTVADGRYLARDGEEQRVLVIETISAAPAPPRRRRRPRSEEDAGAPTVPMARVTAVRAFEPFEEQEAASAWLARTLASAEEIDSILEQGLSLLNRALHAQAAASLDPDAASVPLGAAVVARVGYGTGEEVAAGRYTKADRVDVHATGISRRRAREEELRPQERLAAVLGGREQLDACETLLLRARADLDAGREREAALQLRVALEAMLVELEGALADPGHGEDMAALAAARKSVGAAANAAVAGELDESSAAAVAETTALAERVLRRRRVLRG